MANIFKKDVNWLPIKIAVGAGAVATLVLLAVTFYLTPKYWRAGYQPTQPVPFSHAIHVTQLGMDCRYCHSFVDVSSHSNLPTTQTCMNCHTKVQPNSPKLQPVFDSWKTGQPVQWVRIHAAPDYVYFNHAVHVNRGVSCASCHGQVNEMSVVYHHESLSMGWCLECHTSPEKFIRPDNQVFNMTYKPEQIKQTQDEVGAYLVKNWNIHPPTNCAGCHR
jgi:NAD-dependent SIR2 family protein deacetylase